METTRLPTPAALPRGPWTDRGITLTHVMGGAPGWWMHSVAVSMGVKDFETITAELRRLGYDFWVGYMEDGVAWRVFHRRYDLSIVPVPSPAA